MNYTYYTKGTCSKQIDLEINGDVITNVKFYGGCDGNLKAIPALVDGLTAMGKIRSAFPLSVFRKVIYIICIFVLPMVSDIRYVFYAGSISDAVGAMFSLVVFLRIVNPNLKNELNQRAQRI